MRPLRRRDRRGQGLVEFALVFPVFLLIMFGLFDVGRAVFAFNEITNAAREGARLAIVNQDLSDIDERMQGQMSGAELTGSCVFFLEAAEPPFPTCNEGADAPSDPGDPAVECPPTPDVGCIAHVEAWTEFRPITPLISNFLGPMMLTANSESAIEFVCPNPEIAAWATDCPKNP